MNTQNPIKTEIILAIEGTCDDISFAIFKNKICISLETKSVIKNENGIIPQLAASGIYNNYLNVLQKCLANAKISFSEITKVVYSGCPGLQVSLKITEIIAKSISLLLGICPIPCNHLYAHIVAAFYPDVPDYPILGGVISGGHCNFFLIDNRKTFKLCAISLDDAPGECLDKCGRQMKLSYPAAPKIEKLAKLSTIQISAKKITTNGFNFSFSGLKTFFNNFYNSSSNYTNSDYANFLQKSVFNHICDKLQLLIQKFHPQCIAIGGGVAVNKTLQSQIQKTCDNRGIKLFFPSAKYCGDNAYNIGILHIWINE